jgi:UDP-perosamine 4-acetyltransferase
LSSSKRVVGLGAGGHAKVVIDILQLSGEYEIVGLLDQNPQTWNTLVLDVPVSGDDSLLSGLREQGVGYLFIGTGATGNTRLRQRLYKMALDHGFDIVNAIHPAAVIARSAHIGNGITVMANAVINPDARIGDNVVINTGAIVEHDCVLEDHVHIATGAHLAGSVHVGEGSHVGVGASVRQGIRIGKGSVVGAGAAVVKDVPDNVVVAGVPARILKGSTAHG